MGESETLLALRLTSPVLPAWPVMLYVLLVSLLCSCGVPNYVFSRPSCSPFIGASRFTGGPSFQAVLI